MTQKETWDRLLKEFDDNNTSLEDCVKSFLEILDTKEESDSGNVFNPVYIGSARVMSTAKLGILLSRMRELIKQ